MVTGAQFPRVSWDENFGPKDARRVSELIVETITAALVSPAIGYERLFFIVPTPTPYAKAEAEFLAAAGSVETPSREFRVVTLPRGGKCYAASGVERFRTLLPHAFRMGPPELTLIAANCMFDLTAPDEEVVKFVLAVLGGEPFAKKPEVAGMHFDSGDLVEVF